MRLQIVPCPIVREADGLAMSSRNTYLSETARKEALVLSQSLAEANRLIQSGERDPEAIINVMRKTIETAPLAQIDYIQIVDGRNLEDLKTLKGEVLIALAVKIDQTRLIDNLRLTLPA
jgi:pantoate--beta-alanine ligase